MIQIEKWVDFELNKEKCYYKYKNSLEKVVKITKVVGKM